MTEPTQRPHLGPQPVPALSPNPMMPLESLLRLDGRVAVVTGAARGIGFQIARRLGQAGARVMITDLDTVGAEAAAARLTAEGVTAAGHGMDARSGEENNAAARRAVEEFGPLNIWVANAGIYPANPTATMTDDEWRDVVDVNLNGAYFGARAAFNHRGERSSIVFIASTASYRPRSDARVHYVAAKHGIRGLVTGLAREWGQFGVRVNAVAPGYTRTDGTADLDTPTTNADARTHDATMTQGIPLGRAGTPDDIARVVAFCASDLAAMMSGVVIPVDGGQLTV